MRFFSSKSEAFGLDFSDLSLRIAKLKKKGKSFSLASWGFVEMKPGIIKEGEVKDEQGLINAIKEILGNIKGEKLKTKNVIASLPEKRAFLQVIKMPKMKEEELISAVPFEAENYIPLPINEAYLDFQPVSQPRKDLDHTDVLIAALPRKTIDPYVMCLKKAGLIPKVLEVESQSISRALVKNEISPMPTLILDFGRSNTSFIIFSGYSLRFTSSIYSSSSELNQAISKALKVDIKQAEKLKTKYGLCASKKSKGNEKKICEAMTPGLNELATQIRKYLVYYQTHAGNGQALKNKKIGKVLLCGKGANLKGLVGFLSSFLKVPVEVGNPWINILPRQLKQVPGLSFEDSLGYTTALGLALRGVKQHD